MTDQEDKYLTAEEASALTSIKKVTLYRMAREGRCPAVQVPGTRLIRFPRRTLLEWLASGTMQGKGSKGGS